ncbi:MAG TPA: Ku protein [Candidatus Limnocylindrales bacterium]|nr:Ku protein [Candidatus Limnocylindrales bacterium]
MARSIWKGSLAFGLVEIPVSLVAAEEADELAFHQIDRRTFSRVGTTRINKETGEPVPWSEIVKGYEYEPDEYVILSDEELRRANVKATKTIEIEDFVDQAEIDPRYYERPYYLEPIKKGSKSYALLRETLERTKKVGIARVVLRTRQRIGAVMVRDGVLVLELLRYAYELRDPKKMDLQVPADAEELGVSDREVKMAERLVQGMSARWNPKKYKDDYRDDVLAMIQKKIKAGHTHVIEVPDAEGEADETPRADVVDLMPLLKKSLESREAKVSRSVAARASSGENEKPKTAKSSARKTGGNKKSSGGEGRGTRRSA